MITDLIIFDCDGVLVESETLSAQVMRNMAGAFDMSFTTKSALAFIRGRKVAEWVAELADLAHQDIPASFVPEFRERCAAAFDRDLVAVQPFGAMCELPELLRHWRATLPEPGAVPAASGEVR
jgi:beta-phosphoglucomutase-like phosphatase (HAD superfamily)